MRNADVLLANFRTVADAWQTQRSILTRLCRISGGSAFSRRGPLGFSFEDVRALGFLRPPWGLALDAMFDMSAARPA